MIEARAQLHTFKVNKNSSLNKAAGTIMVLAGRASSRLPTGASKTAYYNMEAINALINGLPHVSSATASNQNAILTAKMGRACT